MIAKCITFKTVQYCLKCMILITYRYLPTPSIGIIGIRISAHNMWERMRSILNCTSFSLAHAHWPYVHCAVMCIKTHENILLIYMWILAKVNSFSPFERCGGSSGSNSAPAINDPWCIRARKLARTHKDRHWANIHTYTHTLARMCTACSRAGRAHAHALICKLVIKLPAMRALCGHKRCAS